MSRAGISPSAELSSASDPLSSGSATPKGTGGRRPHAARRALWLIAGIAFGLVVGFVAGLSRPQNPTWRTAPQRQDPSDPTARDRTPTDPVASPDDPNGADA